MIDPEIGARKRQPGTSQEKSSTQDANVFEDFRSGGRPTGDTSNAKHASVPAPDHASRGAAPEQAADNAHAPDDRQRPPASDPSQSADGLRQAKPGKRRRRRRRGAKARDAKQSAVAQQAATGEVRPEQAEGHDATAGVRKDDAGPHGEQAKRNRSRKRRRRGGRGQGLTVADAGTASTTKSAAQPCAKEAPSQDRSVSEQRRNQSPLYAALDLGTNNCRLLIAMPTRPGQFRVVDAFSRIVRLGEGLGATGRLSDAAMDRAVEALKACAAKLSGRQIHNARLIATEACRAAVNGKDFLTRVKTETGLDLEIVDRETEARLAVSGCSSLVDHETDSVVLFDIGGGSSEIAVIELPQRRSNRLANHIRAWTSLPVGVVSLSERFGGRDVTRDTFEAMVAYVEGLLQAFVCPELRGMCGESENGRFHLIGTSGTVTTLAGVYLDLPRYDRRRVDGLWLANGDVDAMLEKILSWDFAERSANPCIGADRADLVLAGCAIMEGIRRRWPSDRMRVADRGLREGLLTDMMAADGVWRRRRGRFPATDRGGYRNNGEEQSGKGAR